MQHPFSALLCTLEQLDFAQQRYISPSARPRQQKDNRGEQAASNQTADEILQWSHNS